MALLAQFSTWRRFARAAAIGVVLVGCDGRAPPTARWAATNGPLIMEVNWPTNRFGVGEPAEVRLRASLPLGTSLDVAEPCGASNQMVVVDRLVGPVRRRADRETREWVWRLTSFEFGRHVLWSGAPVSMARAEGDAAMLSCPAAIEVGPVRAETDTDWRPLKGPARWPARVPRWIWVLPLVAVLAAALGWATGRRRRTPRPGPPRPPPDRVAREALERLRWSGAIENGQTDYFHVELSRIIREYIEARFGLHAPERTTEEFLHEAAGSGRLAMAHQRVLGDMLEACDLVKFARARPGHAEMRAALDAALRFVDETRLPSNESETAAR